MRIGVALLLAGAVLAGLAFLFYATLPVCGCQGLPAQELALAQESPLVFRVASASPALEYGDVDLLVDGALTSYAARDAPLYGEWTAAREGQALDATQRVLPGDLIVVAQPVDASLQFLDRAANSIMVAIPPLA